MRHTIGTLHVRKQYLEIEHVKAGSKVAGQQCLSYLT